MLGRGEMARQAPSRGADSLAFYRVDVVASWFGAEWERDPFSTRTLTDALTA